MKHVIAIVSLAFSLLAFASQPLFQYSWPNQVKSSLGSHSGTIELRTEKGLKIVEGVARDSTDLYHAKSYRSESDSMEALKIFIFKYTNNDMEF